jgi:ketosteroid isomerase-like protein
LLDERHAPERNVDGHNRPFIRLSDDCTREQPDGQASPRDYRMNACVEMVSFAAMLQARIDMLLAPLAAAPETRSLSSEETTMAQSDVTEEELAELVQLTREAARAYIRGDMRTYFSLMRHGDDYTLMSPFGGEPERGFDTSPARLEALERFFRGGEAELEVVEVYTSGNLAVLVAIERQHGEVGGLPEQDWSLRVTWVFRRDGSGWRQLHRHADPLVHGITLGQLAALARG